MASIRDVREYFKTPLSDIAGTLCTHQHFGRCRDLEMKLVNCLEAYGRERGMKKCDDLVSDYQECFLMKKQVARQQAMLEERKKQNFYEPPPREDAYL